MALDPVTQSLVDAGLMNASGNWLVDPTTGQSFDTTNTNYAAASAAAKAGGVTDAQWAASGTFKEFQTQVVGLYGSTTDTAKLSGDVKYLESQLNDPVLGANARKLRDAAQNRLDELNNPLSPYTQFNIGDTTKTEDSLNADRAFIYKQAQDSYTALLNFGREQSDATKELADQIRLSRDFSIPRPPEQSGKFVAGGSSAQAAAPRVGMSDLMIRY